MKILCIAWARYHRRTEILAEHLNAALVFIYDRRFPRFWQTPLRYIVQAGQTRRILRDQRPDVVLVQNPPIFLVLIAFFYGWRYGARYIIDSHTGAFLASKWRWSVGLHRLLSRRALTTIVHNRSQKELVSKWPGHHLLLAFTPGDYPVGVPVSLSEAFNVAVISGFRSDEPVETVFDAARHLPKVNFYFTGNPSRIDPLLREKMPDNCHLTGYLPYEEYVGLLRGVDVVMTLTKQDHTLLMGGFEAVSLTKPLIISDWPILKDYFRLGTVYVPNTVAGVCEGVSRAQRDLLVLQQDILRLRELLQAEWQQQFAALRELLPK